MHDGRLHLRDLIDAAEQRSATDDPRKQLIAAANLGHELIALGDELLDHFIRKARSSGVSWSDIGSAIGVTKQAAQQRFTAKTNAAVSQSAAEVIATAEAEALAIGHNYVGTEHILLALALSSASTAGCVLHHLGVSAEAITAHTKQVVGCGEDADTPARPLPWTPRARRVIREAGRLARQDRIRRIGTGHLLLAITQQRDNVSVKILRRLGVAPKRVREHVLRSLAASQESAA